MRNVGGEDKRTSKEAFVHLAAGGVVQGAGGEAGQVTEVLEEVEACHADGLWLQLRHLEAQTRINTQLLLLQLFSSLCHKTQIILHKLA